MSKRDEMATIAQRRRTVAAAWRKGLDVLCLAFLMTGIASASTTLKTLVNFAGTNGANPLLAPLVQGTDGNLYGVTYYGGSNGDGTVFKMTPAGTLLTLYNFAGPDGANPAAGLVLGTDGNLYGTTELGGADSDGTIFKVTPKGTLTALYNFVGTDGAYPNKLVQGTDGNFYGMTYSGGIGSCAGGETCGTVFRLTPQGTLTTLHQFAGYPTEGANPEGPLVQGSDGNFYGTTEYGGANLCVNIGCGTVFRVTPAGTLTTLHSFDSADGYEPSSGVVQATDGNFYGTTAEGGANIDGSIFKITSGGTFNVLYNFAGSDGAFPFGTLIQATDGSLYGTTQNGGAINEGTVFKITLEGTLTTLYNFCSSGGSCTDGSEPDSGLVQDTNGTFYGTSYFGGTDNDGTIFSLSVGLRPFVEPVPTSGRVGSAVKILGTNLTGATSVTFNGVSASFTVVAPSLITTTVPTGATTGYVQVVAPHGTLRSNVVFRVKP